MNKFYKNEKNQIIDEQRIDNWLFRSRLIKSRAKAQKIILDGYVKINKNDKNQIIDEQRIDSWLFRSRLIKSREKAQKIILDGHVKINKIRALKPSVKIKIGDIITLTKLDNIFILSVENFAKNRLNAKEAMKLYKEIKIM